MKKTLTAIIAGALISASGIQAKKALDHDSFDNWKSASNTALTRNGEWAVFSVNPQEGDGTLTFYNTRNGKRIDIPRGAAARFTADGKWGIAKIKPPYSVTRKAKIDKKKDFDLPQDSLAIVDLKTGKIEKIADVISFAVGKDGGEWVAWQSCDTTLIKPAALKEKKAGKPLVVRNLANSTQKVVKWVDNYTFSKDGRRIAMTLRKSKKDSIATDGIGIINLPDTAFILLDREHKHYGTPVFDEAGAQLAYIASNDSSDSGTRKSTLYHVSLGANPKDRDIPSPKEMLSSKSERDGIHLMRPHASDPELQARLEKEWAEKTRESKGKEMYVNQYTRPVFSHDGRRLIAGIAPYIAPDDTTIVDFEQAGLDIWRWDAPYTPPQEKSNLKDLREKTMPVVIDLANGKSLLVTSEELADVTAPDRWDGDWALVTDPSEDIISQQWDYFAPVSVSLRNINNGETRQIGKLQKDTYELSPCDRYVMWFADKQYHVYDIATGQTRCISSEIPSTLWDETDDHPLVPQPYGRAGWTDGDNRVLVYDRYDIWSLDPSGKESPVCVTDGYGRQNNLKLRYLKTDPDERTISPGADMLLEIFSYDDKRNGFATARANASKRPDIRTIDTASFGQIRKAKDAPVYTYTKGNFSIIPEIYLAKNTNFAKAECLTNVNDQKKDYSWGTAELVKWRAYDGNESEGVLYKPEGFDEAAPGSIPMLAVFYETGSEELYTHYMMQPSWSWVNYPFYVSRGYAVFVPDIHYTPGIPGENAYNYVCSGVEEMLRRHSQIDPKRVGIDGQSWGGYQTSYLVTRTDMFACAGSGAPVSNMTSAYGGIRWGSGDSRMGQYEMGQSRIGKTLWEAPELYIFNSPVFHADKVDTPLLIMHNDDDGAVPWYQGIEYFMALRRLNKPVWMLQYNGEAHNIKARKNRKDITIRLQQFFDHYLKGSPMPKWMKEGISPLRKGQEMGTELTD